MNDVEMESANLDAFPIKEFIEMTWSEVCVHI